MVSGILLLTFYKKIIYIFHNHVSQSAELSLSFKNDVKISRHYLSVSNSARALSPANQIGLRHFFRPFKRLDKKALKPNFQPKNDRTKI